MGSVQGRFGAIQCLKIAYNSKIPTPRAKHMTEICDSGAIVTQIWGTFDIVVFNVILVPFDAHV